MASSEEWSEGTWVEALPKHPLFKALQEDQEEEDDGGERREKLLLCECRGDLFAWSPARRCLLTTNLKRLHARRDEASVFQVRSH